MSIYLKAKHWQLFIALIGSMFLGQTLMPTSIVIGGGLNSIVVMIPTLIMGIVFFGWLWTIASACSKALPPELSSSPKLMKVGIIYALAYTIFSGEFFFGSGNELPGYVVVMHLLAMAAIFYALGFTAKQLTKLEQKNNVSFFA